MSTRSVLKVSTFEKSHPFLKKKSISQNDSIREAVIRYQQAIKGLTTESSKLCFFQAIQKQSSPFKKGKMNNFTIMAKLKHLQNTALLNNAQHQKSLRQRNRIKQINKNNLRKKKSWAKAQINLNQSYLDIYHKFVHNKNEIQSQSFLTSLLPQSRTQTEPSIKQNDACFKLLNYKQKLKPYRKFSAFIKQKIINRQRQKTQSPESKRKAHSLQLFKSQQKIIGINQQFYDIVKQTQKKQLAEKIKCKQICDLIVDKTLSRILKKPSKEKQKERSNQLLKGKRSVTSDSRVQNKRYASTGSEQIYRNKSGNSQLNSPKKSKTPIFFTTFGLRQRAFQKRESKSANFNRSIER